MSYLKHMPVDIEFAGQGATDDEKVRYALRRERLGQQWFRKQLVAAYDGRCAVSDCGVSEALEAAHIENYRLCGSYLLDKTGYASFAGATLRQPNERQWRPNTVFLEAHRIEFDRSEKKREKAGLLPY